jgi:flagellar assembly factor FliW
MDVSTTRFGTVTISEEDVLHFADGLIGMEDCQRWVLLADAQNSALGWMQSLDRPSVALAVVSPRRFAPDYQIRVSRRDIEPIGLVDPNAAQVVVIMSQVNGSLVLNLKAPLVIHLEQRRGRQIIARDDHAIQFRVNSPQILRKTA